MRVESTVELGRLDEEGGGRETIMRRLDIRIKEEVVTSEYR